MQIFVSRELGLKHPFLFQLAGELKLPEPPVFEIGIGAREEQIDGAGRIAFSQRSLRHLASVPRRMHFSSGKKRYSFRRPRRYQSRVSSRGHGPAYLQGKIPSLGRKGNAGVRLLLCLNFHYVTFYGKMGRDPPFPIFPFTTESFFRGADKRPYADSVTKSILYRRLNRKSNRSPSFRSENAGIFSCFRFLAVPIGLNAI